MNYMRLKLLTFGVQTIQLYLSLHLHYQHLLLQCVLFLQVRDSCNTGCDGGINSFGNHHHNAYGFCIYLRQVLTAADKRSSAEILFACATSQQSVSAFLRQTLIMCGMLFNILICKMSDVFVQKKTTICCEFNVEAASAQHRLVVGIADVTSTSELTSWHVVRVKKRRSTTLAAK